MPLQFLLMDGGSRESVENESAAGKPEIRIGSQCDLNPHMGSTQGPGEPTESQAPLLWFSEGVPWQARAKACHNDCTMEQTSRKTFIGGEKAVLEQGT